MYQSLSRVNCSYDGLAAIVLRRARDIDVLPFITEGKLLEGPTIEDNLININQLSMAIKELVGR